MYANKRRQRNFKRVRALPNGEVSAKCALDIGQFAELLHAHGPPLQQPSAAHVLSSNPSKRHRERLNGELETVASLLPYEEPILQRLDKLSVLRLAVAFLQIKAHFQVCAQKASSSCGGCCAEHPLARLHGSPVGPVPTLVDPQNGMATLDYDEMQFTKLAQKAMGAFLLALHLDGDIFYVTENIEAHLGFQQSDLLHQSLFEMIHSEDRDELRALLQNALEFVSRKGRQRGDGNYCDESQSLTAVLCRSGKSMVPSGDWSFSVVLRFRCLLDHSCGFNRAEFRCRLISVHSHRVELSPFVPPSAQRMRGTAQRGQNAVEFGMDRNSRKYAVVSTCTPFVPSPQMDPLLDDPILKSRHSLDLGFQTLDYRFRRILEMAETPSCPSAAPSSPFEPPKLTLYSFVHPNDLKSVAEAHELAIKDTGSNLLVYRLISTNSHMVNYVQSSFRLFAKNGRPDRIEVNHRMLTEIDGESLLEKRNSQKFKKFSFDDTLLLSPRHQHSQQQQQQVQLVVQPNQQQVEVVAAPRSSFHSDLFDTAVTETPMASLSPLAHSKANLTTVKGKKGKKTGRKANERDRTESDRCGTSKLALEPSPGASMASSSVPTALALLPSPSTVRLPCSQLEQFASVSSSPSSVPSSSVHPVQSHLNSFSVSAPLQPHYLNTHPPLLPPPTSDSAMPNNCQLSSALSWPNAVGALSSPSHANATPRLKRTQFTFERYYAETVDVFAPYGCYYYCPSSSTPSSVLPHNSAPVVDFSAAGSANGIYPPAVGTDYWNSMLAMAANPCGADGGEEDTDCYGGTAQQQQLFAALHPAPADPSAQLSLQLPQQFSPAWLNAAGSVFSFAAAATQFWPSQQQISVAEFGHPPLAPSYPNGGGQCASEHSERQAVGETEAEGTRRGDMASVGRRQQHHHHQQIGDRWTNGETRNDDGHSEQRGARRPDGDAHAQSVAAVPIGTKNSAPPPPVPALSPQGDFPTNAAATVPNASGFRFLTEMAQTLFG